MYNLALIKDDCINIIEKCKPGAYLFYIADSKRYCKTAFKYEEQGFILKDSIFYSDKNKTYLIGIFQKPVFKTYADNVIKYNCGGLNIDKCRIGDEKTSIHNAPVGSFAGGEPDRGSETIYRESTGRFPANFIIHQDLTEVLDKQSGILKSGAIKPHYKKSKIYKGNSLLGGKTILKEYDIPCSQGGASRFFKNVSSLQELYSYLLDLGEQPNKGCIYIRV